MNKSTPIVWMNVTTSFNWQRPPVGIVRVEQSLCKELSELYGIQFKKCVWDNDKFVEILREAQSPQEVKECIDQPKLTKDRKSETSYIYPILTKRQAIKVIAQGLLSLVPNKLRPYLNSFFYFLRSNLGHILHRTIKVKLLGGSKTEIQKLLAQDIRFPFAPGDVLISIGLDWDHQYYKSFYSLRKNHGVKIVSCCYDLIPVIYPQYCVNNVAGIFTSYFLEIADGSDLVLCISKQSEKDLNEMLDQTGGARPVTHVFPLGDNVPENGADELSSSVKSLLSEPFILFVSTIERRKNHEVLYRAYHLLCKKGKKAELPKLVFVGMPGWGVGELYKDMELDPLTQGMIVKLNHVNDTELSKLYESALFCVFPSLYEGWGLPVGEALSMGKAVLSSDRGSLPEVGGELVRYVDPWNVQGWADELYRMSTDDAWRTEWEKKSKGQYKAKTWGDAARSVKDRIEVLMDRV